jgi:putative endonuclease
VTITSSGKQSERLACQYLEQQGLLLLEQNYHSYHGEIDLIMQDKQDIVFVEVRSRSSIAYGSALESINRPKMKKLIITALQYLQKKNWLYIKNSRFDIVTIDLANKVKHPKWIRNAFNIEGSNF